MRAVASHLLSWVALPLLAGCQIWQPQDPFHTPRPTVAQDLYLAGKHYNDARVGRCGLQPIGNQFAYVVELSFSDNRYLLIEVQPYIAPGSYGPTRPSTTVTDNVSYVAIQFRQPPTVGWDTETQSEWAGTGRVQIDQGQRSGSVTAKLGSTDVNGRWTCP